MSARNSLAVICIALILAEVGLANDYLITTVAGNGSFGYSGNGGRAIYAQLNTPFGVAVDQAGNVYIADTGNKVIRKVTPDGHIHFLAAVNATDLTIDSAGNLYASVFDEKQVVRITSDGVVQRVAGDPARFDAGGDGGPAINAGINGPRGLTVDAGGNLYIACLFDNRIRKVTPDGVISTVAGPAGLNRPIGLAIDRENTLYIGDYQNGRILKMTAAGTGSVLAEFQADAIAVALDGSLIFTDGFRNVIRALLPDGTMRILAGDGTPGYSGDGGRASRARLHTPIGLTTDGQGNFWVADVYNNAIRKLEPARIFPAQVLNAATLLPGPITSGEIVLITGDDLGPEVFFNDRPAQVYYADANQVRAVVPELGPDIHSVRLRLGTDEIVLDVAGFAPGVFTRDGSGTGWAMGTSAARGQPISVFATGVRPGAPVIVLIDGLLAELRAVRDTRQPVGVVEIEAIVPPGSRTGDVDLAVIVDGYRNQPYVTVNIQ